jgi:glyoxylase-like metal-dependent hydrolase (beta-lactamase superfamily II)
MPAGSYRFRIGSIECAVLSDGYTSYPTRWLFPNAEADAVGRALDARKLPRERVLSPYTCLLVQTGRSVILVDTGGGEGSTTTGAIRARLEVEGIRPGDVDTVVLTHAHPDHIGGAIDPRGRPVFHNARHVLSETEWDFWNGRADLGRMRVPEELKTKIRKTAAGCLAALRFQVETINGELELIAGVRVLPAPGHTPGHLVLSLSSEGEQLLHLGDAAAHPLHLENPGWHNGFDQNPGVAMETRRGLAERATADHMRLMAFHFPFPSVGSVRPLAQGGWEWLPGWEGAEP